MINVWINPFDTVSMSKRREITTTWDSTDSEERWTSHQKRIADEKIKTYGRDDISYTFNSHGFRCDDFEKDCEILYAGCSFTEGIGIPLEHTWSFMFNQLVSKSIKHQPRYNSIARGGMSASGIARYVYHSIETLKHRPKILCILFPHIFRTEFFPNNYPVDGSDLIDFIPNMDSAKRFKNDKSALEMFNKYNSTLRVSNAIMDFIKNLIFINSICKLHDIQFIWHTWTGFVSFEDFPITMNSAIDEKYHGNFASEKGVYLQHLIYDMCPQEIKETSALKICDIFKAEIDIPNDLKRFDITIARDILHPGPNSHDVFSQALYKATEDKIRKILCN